MAPSVGQGCIQVLKEFAWNDTTEMIFLEHLFFTMYNRPRLIRIGGSVVKFFDMTDFTAIYNNQKLFRI
jgi:hypothetical protein